MEKSYPKKIGYIYKEDYSTTKNTYSIEILRKDKDYVPTVYLKDKPVDIKWAPLPIVNEFRTPIDKHLKGIYKKLDERDNA